MANLLNRLWSTVLRIVLALFGLLMVVGVMAVGAVLGIVLIGWALLRGRGVAPVNFRWQGPVDWRRGRRAGTAAPANTEIVDIEAREVEAPGSVTDQLQQPVKDRSSD